MIQVQSWRGPWFEREVGRVRGLIGMFGIELASCNSRSTLSSFRNNMPLRAQIFLLLMMSYNQLVIHSSDLGYITYIYSSTFLILDKIFASTRFSCLYSRSASCYGWAQNARFEAPRSCPRTSQNHLLSQWYWRPWQLS